MGGIKAGIRAGSSAGCILFMSLGRVAPLFTTCFLAVWNSGICTAQQAPELSIGGATEVSVELPSRQRLETEQAISVQAGKSHYAMCLGCHSPGYNRTGPMHCGLIGRRAGSQTGYQYSEALRGSQLRWNRQTLDTFLTAPVKMVPGTSMTFAGIADAKVRKQLIDYLVTLTLSHADCY